MASLRSLAAISISSMSSEWPWSLPTLRISAHAVFLAVIDANLIVKTLKDTAQRCPSPREDL